MLRNFFPRVVSFVFKQILDKRTLLQEGLEPPTLGLLDPCSTKLSYQSRLFSIRDVRGHFARVVKGPAR